MYFYTKTVRSGRACAESAVALLAPQRWVRGCRVCPWGAAAASLGSTSSPKISETTTMSPFLAELQSHPNFAGIAVPGSNSHPASLDLGQQDFIFTALTQPGFLHRVALR